MNRKYFLLVTLLTLLFPGLGHTEEKITTIDSLMVEVWPDYDQASVLVLLTGTLPANTSLPATVTLPLPEKAELNVIARIDSSDGHMKDDVSYNSLSGKLTFTAPDLRFRLEYYFPYEITTNQRTFNFIWLADVFVTSFNIRVQQPASANSLTTEPAAIEVSKGEGGLIYHTFPAQAIPAGQTFSIRVNYTITSPLLTAARSTPLNTNSQTPVLPSASHTKTNNNWSIAAIALVAILLIFILFWKIPSRKVMTKSPSANPTKKKKQSRSKFCSNCGKSVASNDNFCIKCGTGLLRE